MMTDQEIFNTVWNGLKSQGFEQSLSENDAVCMYRGVNGKKCAAGWIVPDEVYIEDDFETYSPMNIKWFLDNFKTDQLNLILALQNAHDGNEYYNNNKMIIPVVFGAVCTPQEMQKRLAIIAIHFGLTVPLEEVNHV